MVQAKSVIFILAFEYSAFLPKSYFSFSNALNETFSHSSSLGSLFFEIQSFARTISLKRETASVETCFEPICDSFAEPAPSHTTATPHPLSINDIALLSWQGIGGSALMCDLPISEVCTIVQLC